VQAACLGIDETSSQFPGWIGEEHGEHGCFLQAADPGLNAGQCPGPVAVRSGCGGGGVDLASAVRLRNGDSGQVPGQERGQPASAGGSGAVAGDQAAVPEPGRVAQVDVVIPADELQWRLQHRRAAGPAVVGWNRDIQLPGGGQVAADPRQPSAALAVRHRRAHWVPGHQVPEGFLELPQPGHVQFGQAGHTGQDRGQPPHGARSVPAHGRFPVAA
jgi:hypothetical protein